LDTPILERESAEVMEKPKYESELPKVINIQMIWEFGIIIDFALSSTPCSLVWKRKCACLARIITL
jgi:hypothetical protein